MTKDLSTEKAKRMHVAIYAWLYERYHYSKVDDATYDQLAKEIDVNIQTDRPVLDKFFKEEYSSHTGLWIYRHPELSKVDYWCRYILDPPPHVKTKGSNK